PGCAGHQCVLYLWPDLRIDCVGKGAPQLERHRLVAEKNSRKCFPCGFFLLSGQEAMSDTPSIVALLFRERAAPELKREVQIIVRGHTPPRFRSGVTSPAEGGAQQYSPQASIRRRRFSSASPRRYAASVWFSMACAKACSATSRGNDVRSPHQSRNVERKPWTVKSPRFIRSSRLWRA